ncbi:hypothetical protein [Eubacterium xylanophilum]|nr:hypothetical protein [Eubacterium xylanophilum]
MKNQGLACPQRDYPSSQVSLGACLYEKSGFGMPPERVSKCPSEIRGMPI